MWHATSLQATVVASSQGRDGYQRCTQYTCTMCAVEHIPRFAGTIDVSLLAKLPLWEVE